jgi:muramoyltetrapeptide carboxypeptidase LdcA involved in peptidoglycan recycling
MRKIIPDKLSKGDLVRIIAPSRSLAIISQEVRDVANSRFAALGLNLSFGDHVEEEDDFASSPIESRLADLHAAFCDSNVKAILTVIGGFNANQLLDFIDWELIRKNPKIFCGYSDITALNNSFFAKTGLVTYSGPHYSTFGQKLHFDYTREYFQKCLMTTGKFEVLPTENWSDDLWYENQGARKLIPNEGFWILNHGEAQGQILGGNLCTFNLLQGTPYMPNLKDAILFLEDDFESQPHHFDRDLQSLIHLPEFKGVRGLVIGRFQKKSRMTFNLLNQIIKSKKALSRLPVLANVDFGHTDPKITFPVGGKAFLKISQDETKLIITEH